MDSTLKGEKAQPDSRDLRQIGEELIRGREWAELFVGAAAVEISATGSGPTLSLRLSKKEGVPTQLVPEGTPEASVVAVKRVNELDFYSLGANQLAKKLKLSTPKTVTIVDYLNIRKDPSCYKEFKIGRVVHKRYSPQALERIADALKKESADEIWAKRYAAQSMDHQGRSSQPQAGGPVS
jgi:hypothetical protein